MTLAPDVALPAPASTRLRLELTGGLITAVFGAILLLWGPSPADAAAHLYRTFLVEHGVYLWDNFWFAGNYPLLSYSLLYYFPAALIGDVPLVFAAAVASTMLFAAIAWREWGPVAVWPTWAFAVFAAAPLFTGAYAYGVGFSTLLGAIWAAQRHLTWLTIVLAALTLGFSPLAFVFLVLVFAAIAVGRRRIDGTTVVVAAALVLLAVIQLVVLQLFPSPGVYLFHLADLLSVLGVCALGAGLSRYAPRGAPFVAFFVLWGLGSIAAYAVPNSIGDNWTRLRGFVFPLMLVVALLAHFRPRVLAASALLAAFAYNVVPYLQQIPQRTDVRPESASFWAPAVAFLHAHSSPDYRVEVVPTTEHWETYWLPKAGIPIARGWFRQLDISSNRVLYHGHLTGAAYERWLARMGVRYVFVPGTKLDPVGGTMEARVVRSSLHRVASSPAGTIYKTPHPTPIITGPSSARITRLAHETISGRVAAPGRYYLRARYTGYFKVAPAGCVASAPHGMTWLTLPRAGTFTLSVEVFGGTVCG